MKATRRLEYTDFAALAFMAAALAFLCALAPWAFG
jgi:hypothetical protein